MVCVSAKFDAPRPSYGHFGRLVGHGRANTFRTENVFLEIENFQKLHAFEQKIKEDKIIFGHAGALHFSTVTKT